MQSRRFPSVLDTEFRRAIGEQERPETCGQAGVHRQGEGEETRALGLGSDPGFLRLPQGICFPEGGVITLQHWLDLNA
jgi:hypothetical protein